VHTIGEYALVTAPWLTLIQFSTLSEQIALVRELSVLPARDRRVGRLFFPVLGLSMTLTTAVAIIVGGLSVAALRGPVDQPRLVAPALAILAGYAFIDNVSWNMDSVFSAFRAGRELFFARLAQVLTFLVLSVAFRPLSSSVWSMTIATVLSFAFAFVVRLFFIRRYLARVPFADVRQGVRELPRLLKFAVQLVPGSIANGLASQASTWLLGAVASVRTVGAFSRASGIAIRIQDAGFRMSEMVFPSMVQRQHADDAGGMRSDTDLALRGAAIPLFMIAAVGGGVAGSALRVFGEGFDQAADAFALLLVAYSLTVISLMMGNVFLARGKPSLATILVVLRSIVIVGLMFPGAERWGATGAAGAFLVGYVLDVGVRLAIVRRWVFADGFGTVVRTGLATIGAGIPAFLVARVLDESLARPIGFFAGGLAGVVVYVTLVLALGAVSPVERQRSIDAVQRRWRERRRR
jgi:O-antigen/teichoic acid export membrane protein